MSFQLQRRGFEILVKLQLGFVWQRAGNMEELSMAISSPNHPTELPPFSSCGLMKVETEKRSCPPETPPIILGSANCSAVKSLQGCLVRSDRIRPTHSRPYLVLPFSHGQGGVGRKTSVCVFLPFLCSGSLGGGGSSIGDSHLVLGATD